MSSKAKRGEEGAAAHPAASRRKVDAAGEGHGRHPGAGAANGDHPRKGIVYGYARVSTKDQNLARQLDALRVFPVPERNIFCDKASGKDFERPAWHRLERRLRAGDTLVVKSIDRLGRSYSEIIDVWRRLTQGRHVAMVVLDLPLLDTRRSHGDVTGMFLADITLQVLSYVAQVERENTRQRQLEGIAAARARGVKFGRPRIERPASYPEVCRAYHEGSITRAVAAARLGVCPRTFDTWLHDDAVAKRSQPSKGAQGGALGSTNSV